MRLESENKHGCTLRPDLLLCCHPRSGSAVPTMRGSAVPTARVHPPWDGSKGCHFDRRRSRSGETPVFRSLYSHAFRNLLPHIPESTPTRSGMRAKPTWLYPAAAPALLVVCCHPRRGSAVPAVRGSAVPAARVHPPWDGSKGCHLDPGRLQRLSSRPEAKPEWRDPCISFPLHPHVLKSTPTHSGIYSHTFRNETETHMAVPCARTCFSYCHPRRGSAVPTARVHPPWDCSSLGAEVIAYSSSATFLLEIRGVEWLNPKAALAM